jgi:hypothetical protein
MAKSQKVPGGWIQHINPDGTLGGMRHSTAVVADGVIIPENASVLPGAVVAKDRVIGDGENVLPEGGRKPGLVETRPPSRLSMVSRAAIIVRGPLSNYL